MSYPKIDRNLEIVKKRKEDKWKLPRLATHYRMTKSTIHEILSKEAKWKALDKVRSYTQGGTSKG